MARISFRPIIRLAVLCGTVLVSACSIFQEDTSDTGVVQRDEYGNPVLSRTASEEPARSE